MRKYFLYCSLLLIGIAGSLTSCREKIDLTDIDTRSEVKVGLASPLGTIRVAIGDVMLNPVGSNFVIGQDGVITYRDTSRFAMHFQDINWEKYAYESTKPFALPEGFPSGTIPFDLSLPLKFDFALELKDLNMHPEKERFDSILLDYILLSSQLDQENMNLDWNWIDSIIIDLGPQCHRAAGQKYFIYNKYDPAYSDYGFGKPLPSNVDNFSICLMKDRTLKPDLNSKEEFDGNVVDTVKMQLDIYLKVPGGTQLTIGNHASFLYKLNFGGLKHQAIWGYIKPAESMSVKDSIDITGGWNIGEMLRDMKLPFAKPEINFNITTQLAANWKMSSNMLYTTNSKGEKGWASFNGKHSWEKEFPNKIDLGPSTIGEGATYSFKFNNTDSLGHLDSLFSISPERLVYQFGFDFMDPDRYPQVRISSNADVNIEMQVELPMSFNPDLYITYRDTIHDLNLENLVSDALEMKKADLYLVYDAYNEMPIDITGTLYCLDEKGQKLDIFGGSLTFTAQDSSKHVVEIHEQDFDQLAKTKNIVLEFAASDESLQDKLELYPISINKEQILQLQLGFAGNVDAVLNLNK